MRLEVARGGPERDDHTFARGKYRVELLPRLAEQSVYHAVGRIGIVVEKHQRLGSGAARDSDPFLPRGVAPALASRDQLFRSILRVVDEDIGARGELLEFGVKLGVARLVV